MNFLGGLKTKITGIYKTNATVGGNSNLNSLENEGMNLEYDDMSHTLNILQDENKILKNKVRLLETIKG